jgi:hypothetical protein
MGRHRPVGAGGDDPCPPPLGGGGVVTAGYVRREAGKYLDAAADGASFSWIRDKSTDDPARQVFVLPGIGQALLALSDTLGERLADVADAVTHAGSQVSEAMDPPHVIATRGRRWPRWAGRRRSVPAVPATRADTVIVNAPAGLVLSAGEADTVWQALADAAAWRATQDDGPAGGNARHAAIAAEYAALRMRLGGDHR